MTLKSSLAILIFISVQARAQPGLTPEQQEAAEHTALSQTGFLVGHNLTATSDIDPEFAAQFTF